MNIKNYFLGLVLGVGVSCSPTMSLTGVNPQSNISVGQEIVAKKEFSEVIEPYRKQLENQMNQKISYTPIDLDRSGDNSSLGEVLADFMMAEAKDWSHKNGIESLDAVILNIGGIRNNMAKGDILIKNVFEVMPFENELVIIKMKGEDIQLVFDYYTKTKRNNPVAGLNIELENGKLQKGLINGERPQAGKYYYIATSDYLALGGDSMSFFAKGEMITTGLKLRELFIDAFKKTPEIRVKGEQRLKLNSSENE